MYSPSSGIFIVHERSVLVEWGKGGGRRTDENSPDVNKYEQRHVGGKDVVWHALRETVHGVEGVAREGGGHYPPMMRFVQPLVHHWMVQSPVDPINEQIREADEEWELKQAVKCKRRFRWGIVEFPIAADFK